MEKEKPRTLNYQGSRLFYSIPTGDLTILDHKYVCCSGDNIYLITRASSDQSRATFDSVGTTRVEELK